MMIWSQILLAALTIPAATYGIHIVAAAATRRAAIGTRFGLVDLMPSPGALPLSALGGITLTILLLSIPKYDLPAICAVVAVALLAAGAIADARWAWAPDSLVLPLALVAPIAVGHEGWAVLALFAALVVIPLLLWGAMNMAGKPFMTPPDMMALALPPALFGFSYTSVAVYLAAGMLLIAALRLSALRGSKEALADAGDHTGLSSSHPERPRVALLAVMFPLLMLALTLTQSGFL